MSDRCLDHVRMANHQNVLTGMQIPKLLELVNDTGHNVAHQLSPRWPRAAAKAVEALPNGIAVQDIERAVRPIPEPDFDHPLPELNGKSRLRRYGLRGFSGAFERAAVDRGELYISKPSREILRLCPARLIQMNALAPARQRSPDPVVQSVPRQIEGSHLIVQCTG